MPKKKKSKLPKILDQFRTPKKGLIPGKRRRKLKTKLSGNDLEQFRKIEEKPESRWLTKEQIEYASTASPARRNLILRKARKMHKDPAYRAKKLAKKEEKKGRYTAQIAAARKRNRKRMNAATAPWWKAWYTLTNNLGLLIGIVIALSIAFIPIGLFHVIGWSLAVGLVTLVMFIVWVFMEVWFLISQGIVALINVIGQLIVALFNFIGIQTLGSLGFDFEGFDHSLVEDLPLADGSGTWGLANLTPPSFLSLESYMPTTFDTDTILAKLLPPFSDLFHTIYDPIAQRYLDWIATAEWYYVGAIIGIPIIAVIGIIIFIWYTARKRWI